MKASSSYSVANLRDKEFTKKYGTEASIMDYGRFNYVAQPGDGAATIPVIGPYDFFAVEWGYKQFKDANKPADEKAKLEEIVARQTKDSKLLFGDPNPMLDPSQQTEDLSADPIEATELGLKNIDRVAGYIVAATCKKGEDYSLLRNMYQQLVGQRNRELQHVVAVVGGLVQKNFYFGDSDKVYDLIAADKQKKAVEFLIANAFATPTTLIKPEIVDRLGPPLIADSILGAQTSILRNLLSDPRVRRMAECSAKDPACYTPLTLMRDVSGGIFKEVVAAEPTDVDLYRRNLQRAYVDYLGSQLGTSSSTSEIPALARGELQSLLAALEKTKDKKLTDETRLHVDDLKARIKQALEPKVLTAGVPQQAVFFPFDGAPAPVDGTDTREVERPGWIFEPWHRD
jgi:hypothetical protein